MSNHDHACGQLEPLTREDTLDLAFDLLQQAAEHIDAGRISEGQSLNGLAQTAIALTERLPVTMPQGPVH